MAGLSKGSRKTKIVTLALSPQVLVQFPSGTTTSSDSGFKRSGDVTPSSIQPDVALEDRSDGNATPTVPNGEGAAQAQDDKKKKPNPMGRKRAPPMIDPDAPARERARPGPKKKARITDGTTDRADAAKTQSAANINNANAAHKLGPKANTGAINAGLRALDRSGKPCRRWEKKGLQLKSFTGTVWTMSSWNGSYRPGLNADGEVRSDSSSDIKPDASAIASEKSASGDAMDATMANGIESSPAPALAVS